MNMINSCEHCDQCSLISGILHAHNKGIYQTRIVFNPNLWKFPNKCRTVSFGARPQGWVGDMDPLVKFFSVKHDDISWHF